MEITREMYLNALEVVDLYHRENEKSDKLIEDKRIGISEFIQQKDMSVRLINTLTGAMNHNPNLVYIDQLTESAFKSLRNAGRKTWIEFQDVIKSNNIKIGNESQEENQKNETTQKEILSRKEVAQLFGISLVTLHDWVNTEILKPYKISGRTFFKYSELMCLFDSK